MSVRIGDIHPLDTALKQSLTDRSRSRRKSMEQATLAQLAAPAPRNDLLPKLELIDVAVAELKLAGRQVRKTGPGDVADVVASIQRFGFTSPILIGRHNQVVDGALKLEAARVLGLAQVPCIRVGHLTDPELRALRLAINRIGQHRPWDIDALRIELQELVIEQQPITVLGFTSIELDQIMLDPPALEQPVAQPRPDEIAVSTEGDLWLLGEHRLLCGDAKSAADHKRLLAGEIAQLALTDPPYAVAVSKVVKTAHRDFVEGGGDMDQAGFEDLIERSFSAILDALADGGMLMSFMDWKHICDLITIGRRLGYEHLNLVTWVKAQGGMGGLWRSQSEFVVVLKKPGKHKNNIRLGKHGRDRTNVWHVAGAGTKGTDASKMLAHHPTPKPVDMLADAILDVTDRGDIVLDPFGGSGSTLIACERTGRTARLMERDPLYVDVIIKRWQEETGETAVHEDGRSFREVAEQRLEQQGDADE